VVLTEAEREIFDTIMMKEKVATTMSEQLIDHVKGYEMADMEGEDLGRYSRAVRRISS
jgi:hypothetical protein